MLWIGIWCHSVPGRWPAWLNVRHGFQASGIRIRHANMLSSASADDRHNPDERVRSSACEQVASGVGEAQGSPQSWSPRIAGHPVAGSAASRTLVSRDGPVMIRGAVSRRTRRRRRVARSVNRSIGDSFCWPGRLSGFGAAGDRGCEPGYDVLAAPLETEFAHHLLEQFVFGPESVVGSDPLRQPEQIGIRVCVDGGPGGDPGTRAYPLPRCWRCRCGPGHCGFVRGWQTPGRLAVIGVTHQRGRHCCESDRLAGSPRSASRTASW